MWLPNDNYSEDMGLHSIETFTGMGVVNGGSSTNGTVAYDINDAGIAVGRCWVSSLDAMVWDLTGAEDPYPILVGINSVFNALSINNDDPPLITGGSTQLFAWESVNTGFTSGNFSISSGFYHVFDSTAAYLPVTNNQSRTGFGIADTVSASALVAGFMLCDSNDPDCEASGACNDEYNGAAWEHVTSTADELEPLDYNSGESMLVLGHAASNDGFIVGFGRDPGDGSTPCRQRPIFWSDPTDPYVAPVILPPLNGQQDEDELALDIMNSQGNGIDVVGRNSTLGVAVRWRSNIYNTNWVVTDLNAAGVVGYKGNFNHFISANAINDDGWIAGFGEQGDGIEDPIVYRSFVLIPYSVYVGEDLCPPDLAKQSTVGPDGTVNVYDLLVILNNWGTDGLGADLADDDEVVDVDDLDVVINSWGGCIGAVLPETPTLEDVLDDAGLDGNDWDDFIDVLTNSEDEDEIENYLCWMKNYLTGCTMCTPCDAKDPFEDE